MKEDRPMLQVWGTSLLPDCTNINNKLQTKTSTQQTHKNNNYTDKFHNNKNNHMFLTGTHSFQASQPVRSGQDMLVSIDTVKCFLCKIGEKYRFKKKLESEHEKTTSPESSVN